LSWSTFDILARYFHYYYFSTYDAIIFATTTIFVALSISTSASSFDIAYTFHTFPVKRSNYDVASSFLTFLDSSFTP
jgi:hypothetical protein